MRILPLSISKIHFCGIGGIGMSGIAEVLHNLGYAVQGSDIAKNNNVSRLVELGIPVSIGQKGSNLGDSTVVVASSAVRPDNPELMAARQRHIPVVRRSEMLAELMRLKWAIAVGGTHGKTTTTSLIAAMLDTIGKDPTVINGGIINAYGTNARLGEGEWIIVEADESDGTFIKLPATIAVVTNIDPEHLDFYGSFDEVRKAYVSFVGNIPFYGLAVLCIDHPEVQSLLPKISDRKIIKYGFNAQADIRADNFKTNRGRSEFDIVFSGRSSMAGTRLEKVSLPMVGKHNVQNALAAVAIAQEMNAPSEKIRKGLAVFSGVKRRFTVTGRANGITIVDDYGHHPVEINAALAAARASTEKRVIAVVQPHRYSRLNDLFEDFCTCFNDADTVIVADVYSAGEKPINGIDRDNLINGLRSHGHRDVLPLKDGDSLSYLIKDIAKDGDLVICLGAGNITTWANDLPERLSAHLADKDLIHEAKS